MSASERLACGVAAADGQIEARDLLDLGGVGPEGGAAVGGRGGVDDDGLAQRQQPAALGAAARVPVDEDR